MKKNTPVAVVNKNYNLILKLNKHLFPHMGLMNLYEWRKRRHIQETDKYFISIDYFTQNKYFIGDLSDKIAWDVRYASLKDDYWFKPVKSNLKWEDVNFFGNKYGFGIKQYQYCVGREGFENIETEKYTPDNTTIGFSKKFWKKIDNENYLCKGIVNWDFLNTLDVLNQMRSNYGLEKINVVQYKLYKFNEGHGGKVCKCFTTENLSFVELPFMINKKTDTSIEGIIKKFSKVKNFRGYIEMLVLGAYLTDTTIDMFDIGFLCDERNEIVSYAPIIDSKQNDDGTCYVPFDEEENKEKLKKFIDTIEWFDFEKYEKMKEAMQE